MEHSFNVNYFFLTSCEPCACALLHQCKSCIIFVLVQEMAMKHECLCFACRCCSGSSAGFSVWSYEGFFFQETHQWSLVTDATVLLCYLVSLDLLDHRRPPPMCKQRRWQCQSASSSLLGIQIFVTAIPSSIQFGKIIWQALLPQAMKCKLAGQFYELEFLAELETSHDTV